MEEMFEKLEKLKYGEESINESNRLSKFWKELDGSKRDWLDLIEYIYDYDNDK